MPKFLEDKLKAQAANKGLNEKQTMRYVFGAMNNLGAMHGNQETAKGVAMDAKHAADVKAGRVPKGSQASQTESDYGGKTSGGTKSGYPHANLGKYLHPRKSR